MIQRLSVERLCVSNQDEAEAIVTLLERSHALGLENGFVAMDDTAIARIIIEGNVEREGWAAMRRVVELLDNSFAKRNFVILVMARQFLE